VLQFNLNVIYIYKTQLMEQLSYVVLKLLVFGALSILL